MNMVTPVKIKLKKYKYVLHSLSSVLVIPEYTTFNSLIDCLIFAYKNCIDFSITFVRSENIFYFRVKEFLKTVPDSVYDTLYDQYFLGFISFILTNKERDIFKKKLRSFKNA